MSAGPKTRAEKGNSRENKLQTLTLAGGDKKKKKKREEKLKIIPFSDRMEEVHTTLTFTNKTTTPKSFRIILKWYKKISSYLCPYGMMAGDASAIVLRRWICGRIDGWWAQSPGWYRVVSPAQSQPEIGQNLKTENWRKTTLFFGRRIDVFTVKWTNKCWLMSAKSDERIGSILSEIISLLVGRDLSSQWQSMAHWTLSWTQKREWIYTKEEVDVWRVVKKEG